MLLRTGKNPCHFELETLAGVDILLIIDSIDSNYLTDFHLCNYVFRFSIESTQTKVVEEQLVSLTCNQICEGASKDSVIVVDKVIKVSEVICERTETQSFANEDNVGTQNAVGEPQDELNCVLTSEPKAQEKKQELDLGNVGLVSDDCQVILHLP